MERSRPTDVGNPQSESTSEAPLTEDAATVRGEVVYSLTWNEHWDACPAHKDRVRNKGACTCGVVDEANALLDRYESAIRASRPPSDEQLLCVCGHADDAHVTTGETDLDGRPVGGSYEYCVDCQNLALDECVHDFERASVSSLLPPVPRPPLTDSLCEICGCPERVHDDGHNEDGSHPIVATCYGAQAGYPCVQDVHHGFKARAESRPDAALRAAVEAVIPELEDVLEKAALSNKRGIQFYAAISRLRAALAAVEEDTQK